MEIREQSLIGASPLFIERDVCVIVGAFVEAVVIKSSPECRPHLARPDEDGSDHRPTMTHNRKITKHNASHQCDDANCEPTPKISTASKVVILPIFGDQHLNGVRALQVSYTVKT